MNDPSILMICNDLFELMRKHKGTIEKDMIGQYEDTNKKGLKDVNTALRHLVGLKLFEYADSSEYRIYLTPAGWDALDIGFENYLEKRSAAQNQQMTNTIPVVDKLIYQEVKKDSKRSFIEQTVIAIIGGSIATVVGYYLIHFLTHGSIR
ncbi:MAG TPA: hypothetical protein PKD91_12885 [Bacteroidia bacterium]|nr:hypothetical protein [Bacteroidia bacterium]